MSELTELHGVPMSEGHDTSTVLLHRVRTLIETARKVRVERKKSIFGGEKVFFPEQLDEDKELVFVRGDGRIRIITDPKHIDLGQNEKDEGGEFYVIQKQNSPLDLRDIRDGEVLFELLPDDTWQFISDCTDLPFDGRQRLRVFAVQQDPFDLTVKIDLGEAKEGFRWYLEIGGDAKVARPNQFLTRYYAKAKETPFTVQSFIEALGTRPANLLLDKILHDSMEVLTLDDLTVDVAQWAAERNLTEDAFATALAAKRGTPFFVDGEKGAEVTLNVNSVRFSSPARDEAIAARKKAIEDAAKEKKDAQAKADEDARIARDNDARRDEQLKEANHQLKLAEIQKRREALEGPKPEIKMRAQVLMHGNGVGTRDLALCTSSSSPCGQALSKTAPRSSDILAIGDRVRFELSTNFDGWLHIYNYGTSGRVCQLVPGPYSSILDGHIVAGRVYVADNGGDMITVPLQENGPATAQTGRRERFIAIITKHKVNISAASVKELFDRRNPGIGFATRGGFGSVEEVVHGEEDIPLEEAVASIIDLPPEEWVQGTLELEVI